MSKETVLKEEKSEEIKKCYVIYPDKTFTGVSANVYFKNGKSVNSIVDKEKLDFFKRIGYSLELIK